MMRQPQPQIEPTAASSTVADEHLVLKRIATGDQAAFRQVIDHHLPQLLAIARRMLRDGTEAEDVAQDALLRLWRGAAQLELGPAGLKPWLRRVVTNLCIDRVRSSRKLSVVEDVPETLIPPDQQHALEEKELAARVDDALQALPERQRAALVLFHYEGLSLNEVGAAIGVSGEAVESLLSRARRALRTDLQAEWKSMLPDRDDPP